MKKFFNTAGPVKEIHYLLDPLKRWDLEDILELIANQKYFLLHAPRQSGKTSCLLALRDYLNARDDFRCVYVNVECGQVARNNVNKGIKAILSEIGSEVGIQLNRFAVHKELLQIFSSVGAEAALIFSLTHISRSLDKPFVLLIDEIDSLVGDTLVSVLRQIRSGYNRRPDNFPQSVVLSGLVDIKDYKIHRSDGDIITGGSCFNIKSESLMLGNFTKEEIKNLYLEHTKETGQVFNNKVFDLAWEFTAGQPWLVNALAYEACFKMKDNRDRSIEITADFFEEAKERLILSRVTHLDQLADKLSEERVRRVIEPMLLNKDTSVSNDDAQYCTDLGLIRKTRKGFVISNAIYKEVLPRELTGPIQNRFLSKFNPEWENKDLSLNVEKLMAMFQQFWRENSEIWSKDIAGYVEAAHHLIFHGFMQRVTNGHGYVNREYGLGRGRADLFLRWMGAGHQQRILFELKMRTERENTDEAMEKLKEKGLEQTGQYAEICGAEESHLIIFDRREDVSWDEKIYTELHEKNGKKIKIWGV